MKLWKRVKSLFARQEEVPVKPERRTEIFATAMLLLEACYADFDIAEDEIASSRQYLSKIYGISEDDANEIIKEAIAEHPNATSMHPYVSVLNKNLDNDEKEKLLEGLWTIAFTDEEITPEEEQRIRNLASLLHIPHSGYIRIKNSVAEARKA